MFTLPRDHGAPTIRHHVTVVCSVLLTLVAAAPAAAQQDRCQAPPGRSGVEQYCESLPNPGGSEGSGSERERPRVDRGTERELRSAGDDGAALLGLVGASSGGGSGDGGSAGGDTGGGGGSDARPDTPAGSADSSGSAAEPEEEPDGGVLSALTSSVTEGPTVSAVLAWILIAIAIAAFALAWVSWRRGRPDEPAPGGPAS